MKKLLITTIILVNASTAYFWLFPYQSEADINTFQLADRALKRQTEIIGTASQNTFRIIEKQVEAYPEHKGIEDTAKLIYEIYRAAYNDVQVLKDEITGGLPEGYFMMMHESEDAYSLWNRLRPFHYNVPKRVFRTNLADFCKTIQGKQDKILTYIDDGDFKKKLKDSLFVDVENLPELLDDVSFMQSLALLSSIQNRLYIAQTRTLEQLAYKAEQSSSGNNFKEFVPIVYANTSHLKLGDTYEAEVFAAAYSRHPGIKATVDGKEIPVKDGVAILYGYTYFDW
ncbi:MAG: hypothetical protein HC803_07175 [Saprospiraceae bacterium]|nr:hypothetical protein [Saprospiraceae bacterium]